MSNYKGANMTDLNHGLTTTGSMNEGNFKEAEQAEIGRVIIKKMAKEKLIKTSLVFVINKSRLKRMLILWRMS